MRPSQSRPRCGNGDASLSSSPATCDLDRPADGGHASDAPAAFSGNDARHSEGCNDEPHPGTRASSSDDPDHTKSRGRQLSGNDRKRSDGNRDGGARPRPPSAWTSPPAGGILLLLGRHTPGLPAVGGHLAWSRPRRSLHTPTWTPARALARDDDAEKTVSRKRGQIAGIARFSSAVNRWSQRRCALRCRRSNTPLRGCYSRGGALCRARKPSDRSFRAPLRWPGPAR